MKSFYWLKAPLLVGKFSNQLPKLQKCQLPIIVFVQRAHELLDYGWIAGVLQTIRDKKGDSDPIQAQTGLTMSCMVKATLPSNGK
jgi:hypothetical protein